MKKYFIIAVAALAASAACTKNVTETPASPIAFQVANYVPQTKANVVFNGTEFKTSAWFHADASATAQDFMSSETIKFQSNKTWAADRVYFWPKTGWINFFSWAGTPEPAVTEGTAAYGASSAPVTIATNADAMLAEAAYRYSNANADTNLYTDPILYSGVDTKGVPTLFHHMLAQVNFIVKLITVTRVISTLHSPSPLPPDRPGLSPPTPSTGTLLPIPTSPEPSILETLTS